MAHRRQKVALGAIRLRRLDREAFELGLGPFLILDVGVRAEPPNDSVVAIPLSGRPHEMPPILTMRRAPQPELGLIRLARGDGPLPPLDRRRDVFSVQHGRPAGRR